jgi:hypothetical protein
MVTSNLPFEEWIELFDSERFTEIHVDWITSKCHVLKVNGQSYLLRHAKQGFKYAYPVSTGSSDSAKHVWPGLKTPRITDLTTGRAFKPFGPPDTLQMAGAGRLIREKRLKLQQSPRVI